MAKYLIFVDTNILLDFYRVRHESGLTLLKRLDDIHDRLITSYQVEMEFKRNRQAVIVEFLRNLKKLEKVQHAAFLAETKAADMLNRGIGGTNKRIDTLKGRLKKVLAKPTGYDPVYKVVQRLFTDDTPLNLTRKKKVRGLVKRRAFRRFILGYPPRKAADTSMGDALNWEWIIEVARETGSHVAIVSRDADYGVELEQQPHINDWLVQEFRDRVSRRRQCLLFNRLAPAFKLAKVAVTPEAEKEEKEDLARTRESARDYWQTLAYKMLRAYPKLSSPPSFTADEASRILLEKIRTLTGEPSKEPESEV